MLVGREEEEPRNKKACGSRGSLVGGVCGPCGLSGLFLVGPPQPLLDLQGQGIEEVLLHHQPAALQQGAIAQLHWQALQAVPPQFYLGQARQLAHPGRQRLQHVVPQVQSPKLSALEELRWEALNLEEGRRKGGRTIHYLNTHTGKVAPLQTSRNCS